PGCSKGRAEYRATAKIRPFCNLSEGLSTPFPLATPYVKPTSRDGFERTRIRHRRIHVRSGPETPIAHSVLVRHQRLFSRAESPDSLRHPAKLTRQPSCHEQQNRLHNQFYPAPIYVFETADPPAQMCDETQH